jgi:hypothetical protein
VNIDFLKINYYTNFKEIKFKELKGIHQEMMLKVFLIISKRFSTRFSKPCKFKKVA